MANVLRHLRTVGLTGLATLVLIVIVDAFTFIVLDMKPPGHEPERFFHFSPLLGWFHKPSSEGYWYRYSNGTKFHVRTNEYGFADSPREVEKTRPRIALVGDSTTQFWEAEEADRGQVVIEELLDGSHEVLNFGVRGYGTDQSYLLFQHLGVHFNADIVVYTFCINDIANNATRASKPYFVENPDTGELVKAGYPVGRMMSQFENSFAWTDYSLTLRLLERVIRRYRSERHPPNLNQHFELRAFRSEYNEEDERRMRVTTKLISRLAAAVEEKGNKFIVVEGIYQPVIDEEMKKRLVARYGPVFDFDTVTRRLRDHLEQEGIEFLSLPEIIKEKGIDTGDLMPAWESMHLAAPGIRLYSETLIDRLHSLGWLKNTVQTST